MRWHRRAPANPPLYPTKTRVKIVAVFAVLPCGSSRVNGKSLAVTRNVPRSCTQTG